jgi:hypothetical protein
VTRPRFCQSSFTNFASPNHSISKRSPSTRISDSCAG